MCSNSLMRMNINNWLKKDASQVISLLMMVMTFFAFLIFAENLGYFDDGEEHLGVHDDTSEGNDMELIFR